MGMRCRAHLSCLMFRVVRSNLWLSWHLSHPFCSYVPADQGGQKISVNKMPVLIPTFLESNILPYRSIFITSCTYNDMPLTSLINHELCIKVIICAYLIIITICGNTSSAASFGDFTTNWLLSQVYFYQR